MGSPAESVNTYIVAKDGNRPHLMRMAFSPDAELEMVVKTDAISFPARGRGLDAIEDILCRRMADEFENIYTFCLSRPVAANRRHFPCHWLVGMSAKNTGEIRIGSGRYDWYFSAGSDCLVDRLIITIDRMQVLPAGRRQEILSWLGRMPYPWCNPGALIESMPVLEDLGDIRQYLLDARPLTPAPIEGQVAGARTE